MYIYNIYYKYMNNTFVFHVVEYCSKIRDLRKGIFEVEIFWMIIIAIRFCIK